MELEELEKSINTFVDEFDLYMNADKIDKIKPSIDKYITQLDTIT